MKYKLQKSSGFLAVEGAHKETQVPFKHMLNWRFSSGCSKELGSLFDITQIVFEQSHL